MDSTTAGDREARTPTQPPSLTFATHTCTDCLTLKHQLDNLVRQVKEVGRKNRDLEKRLEEGEKKSKQKDMLIKSLDSENQAIQLQVSAIN